MTEPSPTGPGELAEFYERGYSGDRAAERNSRWRALGAVGKADHVIELCARATRPQNNILDVGCGDGALLCELRRRGFGGRHEGVEIASAAVALARSRGLDAVELYDGEHLPAADGEYDLGILSHVLEHVPDPSALLAETARACRSVVMEVPLEDNLSARRANKREHAAEVGHLQRLSRGTARAIVAAAGLRVAAEIEDPLPLAVHRFLARPSRAGQARATGKWALRAGLHGLAPGVARGLFTVHYACLCLR
ncbi:MAG TPA: class I SAM-dependent methyltransferase [Solirubrobacteraceae bacterium]|nr:class I SAM-dependent methyltransferase [Solirubrobacteraceae bacterium]